MFISARMISLLVALNAATACSPQNGGGEESANKDWNPKSGNTPTSGGNKERFTGSRDDQGNLPESVRAALKGLPVALDQVAVESMALTASSAGILNRLPPDQQKMFVIQNQGIANCTIGQYRAIAFNDRLNVCKLAKSCGLNLGDIERNYFDIHKLLLSSYRVLQDAATVNESSYCGSQGIPMGLP